MKIETFTTDEIQPHRWRLKATNGRVIASGEGYRRKADRDRAVEIVRGDRDWPVVEVEG